MAPKHIAVLALVLGLAATAGAPSASAADAPTRQVSGWRGDGSGVFPDVTPPTKWDSEKKQGILWSTKVGKSLHTSPIVAGGGDKVLTLAEPDTIVCLDAKTGKQLWSKATTARDLPAEVELGVLHEETGNTTPTPVTDGKNVYVVFANGLVTCFDLEGNRKWIVFNKEPSDTGYGRTASPILVGGKLIVSMGFLTALDPATGKELWKSDKVVEQFGAPAATNIGGADILVALSGQVVNAQDGSVISKGVGELKYNSPVASGNKAFLMDSDMFAAQVGKQEADCKKLWSGELEGEFFSSPVAFEGIVYAVSNDGVLFATDAEKGTILYKKELGIANMSGKPDLPPGNLYPSLSIAGKKLFVCNDQGETVIVEPGKEYKEIARNKIDDIMSGNMVFAGKRIFVRSRDTIYCIGD